MNNLVYPAKYPIQLGLSPVQLLAQHQSLSPVQFQENYLSHRIPPFHFQRKYLFHQIGGGVRAWGQ